VDGRQLADFSLVDQPTIGLRRAVAASKAEVGPLPWGVTPKGTLRPLRAGAQEEVENMKHAGLHALNWGLQKLAIVLAVTFVALLAVAVFVTVLVAIQAVATFGQ
jgi:hypothetical protein